MRLQGVPVWVARVTLAAPVLLDGDLEWLLESRVVVDIRVGHRGGSP